MIKVIKQLSEEHVNVYIRRVETKAAISSLMYLGTYFVCIPVNQFYRCALPSRQPHHQESIQRGKNPSRNSGSNFPKAFDFPTEYMRPLHSYVS